MPNAVIYIPLHGSAAQQRRWRDICAEACIRRRYRPIAVVFMWADAAQMIRSGKAGVAIAALPDHFPLGYEPRCEAASDPDAPQPVVSPTQRRTRRRT